MKQGFMAFCLSSLMLLAGGDALAAKRLGGGQSVGKQSTQVTQRETTRQAAPTPAPAPAQAAPAAVPPKPVAAPAPAAKKPWGAMLGGLAAGLGLAWLAHSLGMGEAFGNVLMIALVAMLVVMAIGWFLRSRRPAGQYNSPYAFQGAGSGAAVPMPSDVKPSYRPENVGNDASARPWEQQATAFETAASPSGVRIGSALVADHTGWGIPADFDVNGFVETAKGHFINLQSAWDRSDLATLRAMMTDEMMAEIQQQLNDREKHTGPAPNHTEVVMLNGQLLGIEDLGGAYMASVEFSGMIREEPSSGPSPFREVWNMTKPKSGDSGWLVAGVQALQ